MCPIYTHHYLLPPPPPPSHAPTPPHTQVCVWVCVLYIPTITCPPSPPLHTHTHPSTHAGVWRGMCPIYTHHYLHPPPPPHTQVCGGVCVLYVPTITCTPSPPSTHAPTPLVSSGLLGAHFAAVALRDKGHHQLAWYTDQLLEKAEEVGQRLLPAFNTTTGLPYPKVCTVHILHHMHSGCSTQ